MITGTFTRNLAALTAIAFLTAGGLAIPGARAQAPAPAAAPPAATPAPAPKTPRYDAASVEARIKRLHDRLKITAAETDLWNQVAQVMRDNARDLDTLIRSRDHDARTMSAVDNLRNYQKIADAHADGLKKLVTAFGALYDAMPDSQKATADAVFGRRVRGHAAAAKPGKG